MKRFADWIRYSKRLRPRIVRLALRCPEGSRRRKALAAFLYPGDAEINFK